ncbi:hypothetical protein [Flavobacterium phragmitis]|uniref:Lipoprotein n=1 Tax=Flavobacterium phragmitis TaxID=739143 RepID=A0A1I1NCZ7_9FLAO|nr:hypothetical protein [Flavobacterium phragmitis]SFC95417.1 hypothetical protein SAMN05216297_103215 [Flavobacterium phragmitis]
MKNLSLILICILLFSCQKKENNIIPKEEKNIISIDSSTTIVKEENKQIGDTIFMNFKDNKDLFLAESSLDSINSKIYVKFKNEDAAELKAEILPAKGKGNIRFNQIILPDNTSDGPFGMDLKIPLKQKGSYVLVIGHSLMAENPYYGKFKIQLEVKKE